jgi:hypothetical protein
VADHQGATGEVAAGLGEHLAQRAHLADALVVAGLDDGERLVEPHGLTAAQVGGGHRGRHGDAHPPARGEHVDRLVGVAGQEHPVAAGRLGEPVDLLAQRDQLAARLLEGLGELLVARRQLGEPAGGLGESLLEDTGVAWRFGELAAQQRHFLLEEADLRGGLRGTEVPGVTVITPAGTVVGVHGILPPCSVSIRYLATPRATLRRTGDPSLSLAGASTRRYQPPP